MIYYIEQVSSYDILKHFNYLQHSRTLSILNGAHRINGGFGGSRDAALGERLQRAAISTDRRVVVNPHDFPEASIIRGPIRGAEAGGWPDDQGRSDDWHRRRHGHAR